MAESIRSPYYLKTASQTSNYQNPLRPVEPLSLYLNFPLETNRTMPNTSSIHNEEQDFALPDIFVGDWGKVNFDDINLGGLDPYNLSTVSIGDTYSSMDTAVSPESDKSLSPSSKDKASEPVTKVRNGPGRHPRQRPKPQNMFSVWNQSQQPNQPQMMSTPMGFPSTSPYMDYGLQTSPMMNVNMADPTAWMHAGRPRRQTSYMPYGVGGSPSLLYNPYSTSITSPPFGFQMPQQQSYFPMFQQSAPMKLPVQALPRASESTPQREASIMAPLVLPADLGKNQQPIASKDQVDPAAIPSAITTFLGSNGEASNLGESMRLYEMTFEAFIEEEAQIDYSNVTVVELKKLLRKYQLAATGKKDELIRMVKDVASFLKNLKRPESEKQKTDSKENKDEMLGGGTKIQNEAESKSEKRDAYLDFIA